MTALFFEREGTLFSAGTFFCFFLRGAGGARYGVVGKLKKKKIQKNNIFIVFFF